MAGYPLPIDQQVFDNNGDPAVGYLLYTYAAGTSTPLTTYQDQGLTIPNTNPIELDSAGRAQIFVPDGVAYKLVLTTPDGVGIWTRDNISVPTVPTPEAPEAVPVGAILPYGGSVAPDGYLLCDGSPVSRVTYADLFAVIGTTFGSGNGSTTFNLPDLRGRFPFGVNTSGTGNTLGATFGQIDHVHSGPAHTHQIAAHKHSMEHTHSVPHNGWTTNENSPPEAGVLQAGGSGTGSEGSVSQATAPNTTGAASTSQTGETALTTESSGTGNTGPANPPGLALNFIIKY